MPKRLVDGEALWRSDKLNQVEPKEFRPEYANLIPLAQADGTFEANARRVWADVYSYNRPDITEDLVEDFLNEFERVGMLERKTDQNGKIWGRLIGVESRLPSESTKERYKKGNASLFNTSTGSRENHDELMTTSRGDRDGVMLGLDRIGEDRIGDGSAATDDSTPSYREGMYPSKGPKNLHKRIVEVWQKIKGPAAIARYPSRYPDKWEELCQNHSGDLIIPAFELWVREEGPYLNVEYPVSDFLRVAAKYMERILPTNTKPPRDKFAGEIAAQIEIVQKDLAESLHQQEEEDRLIEEQKGVLF